MTQRELILRALDGEPMQRGDIAEECGIEPNSLSTVLNLLKQERLIIRVPEGWTLASKAPRRRRAPGPDPAADPTAPGALDEHFSPAPQPASRAIPSFAKISRAIPSFAKITANDERGGKSNPVSHKLLFAISEGGDLLIDRVDGSGARAVIERDEVCRLMQFLQRCEALLEAA